MIYEYAVALTGGIGSGKSSVCSIFRLYGFKIIDADKIAKKRLAECKNEIISLLGSDILNNGELDRKKIGAKVFNNKSLKIELENILHPKIREEIEEEAKKLDVFRAPYIIDIPLFYETKAYNIKNVALIYASKEQQLERIIKRDSISKEEAIKKIESQISNEQKREWATYIIDNTKDVKNLQDECERVIKLIKKDFNYKGK